MGFFMVLDVEQQKPLWSRRQFDPFVFMQEMLLCLVAYFMALAIAQLQDAPWNIP